MHLIVICTKNGNTNNPNLPGPPTTDLDFLLLLTFCYDNIFSVLVVSIINHIFKDI